MSKPPIGCRSEEYLRYVPRDPLTLHNHSMSTPQQISSFFGFILSYCKKEYEGFVSPVFLVMSSRVRGERGRLSTYFILSYCHQSGT